MRAEYVSRWQQDFERFQGRLKKPIDLVRRGVSPEDFIDSAIIGGVPLADLIAGKLEELEVPHAVLHAFRATFPNLDRTFTEEIKRLALEPAAVQGLVGRVKEKLFEIDYVHWLNSGNLPTGYSAKLVPNAENSTWDILIHDHHGTLHDLLQQQANAGVAMVHEAIAAHPAIDVILPHNLYERLSEHTGFLSELVGSHHDLGQVTSQMADAETAGVHFHLPVLALVFAAGQNYRRYRNGHSTLEEALQNFAERGVLAMGATFAGWAAGLAAHSTVVGIPFAMAVRMAGMQIFHNRDLRKLLDEQIRTVESSRIHLEERFRARELPSGA